MEYAQFGAMPNWWFRNDFLLSNLKGNKIGEGISAMKCLLALAVLVDFKTKSTTNSISDLERVTGLSRPMVITGVDTLEKLGVIHVDRSNYRNLYVLIEADDDKKWAKVPVDKIRGCLSSISNRGVAPFASLKIYIALVSLRYQDKNSVNISHEKLREYTHLQPSQIRKGLDVLFSCSLIHTIRSEERKSFDYLMLGLTSSRKKTQPKTGFFI